MNYTENFKKLKGLYDENRDEIRIPELGISIFNVSFSSNLPTEEFIRNDDRMIAENRAFTYPVFAPENRESDRVILLFHGLNERSWVKYLTWAASLVTMTGAYVVLFPLSFHINRSPSAWKDPRAMHDLLKFRNIQSGGNELSSFANVALSNRLTEDPMRFFRSGYQTVEDIIKLSGDIFHGKHPIVPATGKIDIFAYSIGAFMAEIIMLGNPENIFTDSRLFILAGGSVFSNMKGTSKYIMDKRAFDKVYDFYMRDFENTITGRSALNDFLRNNPVGVAFRSMIDIARFKTFRESRLKKLRDQIAAVALTRDTVIPVHGIENTLTGHAGKCRLKILDFPFSYSHENPFPLFESNLSQMVDAWFEKIFLEAGAFLA